MMPDPEVTCEKDGLAVWSYVYTVYALAAAPQLIKSE